VVVVSAAPSTGPYDARVISARGKGGYQKLEDSPKSKSKPLGLPQQPPPQGHGLPALPHIDPHSSSAPPPLAVAPAKPPSTGQKALNALKNAIPNKSRREFDDSDEVLALRDIIATLSRREIDDLD